MILAEGNTSARLDDGTFWVKASGCGLGTATPASFVRVRADAVLPLLDGPLLPDVELDQALVDARVDPVDDAHPSVETIMHAALLGIEDVRFIGHTHPSAINMITCSRRFEAALAGRLFPDEIVLCGPRRVLVPYTDPGVPLALAVRDGVLGHLDRHGECPKVVYLQNHGFVALGPSARQVEDITAMAVKAARILLGATALGGASFLTPRNVERIHGRPDEHYRQRKLEERQS